MGEMADYSLEEVDDEEEARLDWLLGSMSFEEALDRGIIDEQGNYLGSSGGAA